MKKILRITFILFLGANAVSLYGQAESSAFTATGRGGVATTFMNDYQTIGINPANLGWVKNFRDPKYSFGFFETSFTFFSEALTRQDLKSAIAKGQGGGFSQQEKYDAFQKLGGTSFAVNSDIMLMGGSMQLPNKRGGLAFNMRDKIQVFARINQTAAELMFLGATSSYFQKLLLSNGELIDNPNYNPNFPEAATTAFVPLDEETASKVVKGQFVPDDNGDINAKNYSTLLNGTRISAVWFREYNLSYGRQLYDSYDLSVFAGVGIKFLQGFLNIELQVENNQLIESTIAHSPTFGLDFGDGSSVAQSPTFRGSETGASPIKQLLFPKSVGNGLGLDLGITFVIKRHLVIGAALTNYGKLKWNGNVAQVSDGTLQQFSGAGFDNLNLLANKKGSFQFAGDDSPFKWEGSDASKTVELPTTFRLGASYDLYGTYNFGIDIIQPTNKVSGNLEKTLIAIGTDFRPFKLFRFSTGLNFGGNNGSKINIPFGVTYLGRKGYYEAGIAARDISTFLANFGNGSTISFALGFLRFKM